MAEMWCYLRFSTIKFPQIIGGIPIECSTYCLTIKRSYEISKWVERLCQLQSTIKVLWRERIGFLCEGEETLIAREDLCNEVKALGNHLTADVNKQKCYFRTIITEAGSKYASGKPNKKELSLFFGFFLRIKAVFSGTQPEQLNHLWLVLR